ncbi:MAG: EF-P lysine aminoacylase EpmA [Gammaproteobacteria bacterium]
MSDSDNDWRPTATREALVHRAQALARVREFFAKCSVLEVDTPVVVNAPVTDVHVHSAEVRFPDAQGRYYLHTSPEFAMKRLLASGSGDIYQVCHVARGLERGRQHNAEFTLIEWYRLGYSLEQLMDEVEALAREVLGPVAKPMHSERVSYAEAFKTWLGIDPLAASIAELRAAARDAGLTPRTPPPADEAGSAGNVTPPAREDDTAERDELLEFLMGAKIGPMLGRNALTFVHRYPASQAALARLDERDPRCALRFELYCEGIELANGFHELASASEQRARFKHDLAERRRRRLPADEMDERLLGALQAGLPDCAGVALGFDRLLMLATGASHIDEVMPFPIERA